MCVYLVRMVGVPIGHYLLVAVAVFLFWLCCYCTDTISHGSFRSSKRKQLQQEAAAEHPKVTVDALKETPPLRKRVAKARRARLRPLVHFDHQSIPIVVGALPSNNNQFGTIMWWGNHLIIVCFNYLEQRGNCKSVTGASAAHATVYEDLATFRDHGDKISNELVLSCPYFRNEVILIWLPTLLSCFKFVSHTTNQFNTAFALLT